jgi:hypothetical protein
MSNFAFLRLGPKILGFEFYCPSLTPSNWPASEAGQLLGVARVREAYLSIASDAIVT